MQCSITYICLQDFVVNLPLRVAVPEIHIDCPCCSDSGVYQHCTSFLGRLQWHARLCAAGLRETAAVCAPRSVRPAGELPEGCSH